MQRLNAVLMRGNMAYHVTQSKWKWMDFYQNMWGKWCITIGGLSILQKCKTYVNQTASHSASQPFKWYSRAEANNQIKRDIYLTASFLLLLLLSIFYASLLSESRIYGKTVFSSIQGIDLFCNDNWKSRKWRAITLNGSNSACI